MIINVPEIKNKLIQWFWILLPLFMGLIMNFLYYIENNNYRFFSIDNIVGHITLLGLSIVFIIGGISSYFIFKNKKKIWNYSFCMIAIFYTQIMMFYYAMLSGKENRIVNIIYLFLLLYGLYLTFKGAIHLKSLISNSFRDWLRKKNIHIISSKNERALKEKYPDLDFTKPINFEERFSKFNSEITEINKLLARHSDNLISELKLFEYDALTMKKKFAEENTNLVSVKEEVEKLNKLKNISEEQIDILLEKQNKGQMASIIIGFVLGIVGSIIASFVYENLLK